MPTAKTRLATKVFLAVFLAAFAFAAYTQHAWEDYWITFRASRNLATGHGLVFTPGERLHTFTSPLGVLLPAGLSWVTGNGSEELVLWLFRLISIAALAAGVVLLSGLLRKLQQNPLATVCTVALVALNAKTVDFSINGMETGLLIFFLALTLHGLTVTGPRQMLRLGVGWAGMMWSRPDSCLYLGVLGLGALVFMPAAAERTRRDWFGILFRAGLVCAALYLPWFLWAWHYYGSPVPHTIVAKGTNLPPLSLVGLAESFVLFPFRKLLDSASSIWWTFAPAYAWLGGWNYFSLAVNALLAWTAALAWLCPLLRPQTRMLSLGFYAGQVYLSDVVKLPFPWYLPLVETLGYLTLGLMFDQLLGFARQLPRLNWDRGWFRHLSPVLRVCALALVAGQIVVTGCVARQMRTQQEYIEDGLRRPIGLWLRDHAGSPNDTVMLEPLGYIGYFSRLKMLDYPGLSSKEVVEVRRRLGPQKEKQAYLELKPDWLVLRPYEARGQTLIDATRLEEFYEPVAVFDASDKVNAVRWLPGKNYLQIDQKFFIFHRKAGGDSKAAP